MMDPREVAAWQTWITSYASWTWFVTLTFKYHTSKSRAEDAVRRWLRHLAQHVVLDHFEVFGAIEQQSGGRWHAHMLLALPQWFDAKAMRAAEVFWRRVDVADGSTHVSRYDERLGPGAVLYCVCERSWFGPGSICPRTGDCRRSSCVRGSRPL